MKDATVAFRVTAVGRWDAPRPRARVGELGRLRLRDGIVVDLLTGANYCKDPDALRSRSVVRSVRTPPGPTCLRHCAAECRRGYARVLVGFPQSCIEHQQAERFFE